MRACASSTRCLTSLTALVAEGHDLFTIIFPEPFTVTDLMGAESLFIDLTVALQWDARSAWR